MSISDTQFQEWDDLFDAGKAPELLPLLREAEKTNSSNPELLWRISRCIFEMGTNQEDNDAKVLTTLTSAHSNIQKAKYEEALAAANKTIEVAPNHWGGIIIEAYIDAYL